MIQATHNAVHADKLRTLLRKLRDLNLRTGPVAITRDLHVTIRGCLSLDGPAESGVRYRLELDDGREGLLELLCGASGLEVALDGARHAALERRLSVHVTWDSEGRACARDLGARVSPESTDRRHLEHFLRRVVRTAFRAA